MLKSISILLIFFIALAPFQALALETQTSTIGRISILEENDIAPFSGILYDYQAEAERTAEENNSKSLMMLEKKREIDLLDAKLNLKINEIQIERDAWKSKYEIIIPIKNDQIDFLNKQIEKANSPNNELWFALGFGTGVLTTIVITIIVVDKLNKD